MKTLMILGALEEFVTLVKKAREQGFRTVVVDGYENAPAKEYADKAYTVDVRNIQEIAALAKAEHVDAITTAYSDLLLECMVKIAEQASLPCHLTTHMLKYYRDKDVTNKTCEQLSIPTPKSIPLKEDFSDEQLSGYHFPMVIKPLDLYGSRGLRVVHSPKEIREQFTNSCELSERKEVLAEEYNPDYEFNVQCYVHKGTVHILGLCDREKTLFDPATVPLSTRNIYPSRLISQVYESALKALTAYIAYTGQTEGPLSMQFYWGKDRGFEVGEIAARYLGYEHELIEMATGLSLEDVLLASAKGGEEIEAVLKEANPFGSSSAAVVYFHGEDGIIQDLSGAEEALHHPAVSYGQIFYHRGDRIGNPQRMPYAARYDIHAKTRKEVDLATLEILDKASMKDENGRELLLKGIPGVYEKEER